MGTLKLMAVIALAGGLVAAPVMTTGTASAAPCDSADCVPYVAHGVTEGTACVLQGTRYAFGLDASGSTFICNLKNRWEAVPPLVGVRLVRSPCDANQQGMAQSPDGLPMSCKTGGWTPDFDAIFY